MWDRKRGWSFSWVGFEILVEQEWWIFVLIHAYRKQYWFWCSPSHGLGRSSGLKTEKMKMANEGQILCCTWHSSSFKNCLLTKARRKDLQKVWIFRCYMIINGVTIWSKLSVGKTCSMSAFDGVVMAKYSDSFVYLFVLLCSINNFWTSVCEPRSVGRSLWNSCLRLFR